MAFVELRGISKRFGPVRAVDDVSLEVEKGEFVSLLGPSGCGKTTTLRVIAGLERPDSGRVFIDGQDLSAVPPSKRGIGMVFQDYALFPHMRVFDNIAFGLRMQKLDKREIEEKVKKALDLVHLPGLEDRFSKQLSGGQQQRVAMARSIVVEPRVFLMDEPLSNLDAKLREAMRVEIRSLQQRLEITTIYVTHDQEEALTLSDRIAVMEGGQLVQLGTPRDLYYHPTSAFVADFIGRSNLLEGEVVDATPSASKMATPEGIIFLLPETYSAPRTGEAVQIAIRTENIELDEAVEELGTNQFHAEIRHIQYKGPSTRFYVRLSDSMDLVVDAPSTARTREFSPGDRISARVPPDSIIIVP